MARKLGVGIIGCGNISAAYFNLAPLFKGIEMRACADINMAAAEARAKEFGVRAKTVDALLAANDIDIVVNLTIPAAHYGVIRQVLEAGKHVYSEKPFVLVVEEGLDLKARADEEGLRVGSAPDTFLGGAHQLARELDRRGHARQDHQRHRHVMSHGMEHWHPNPDFFFQPGAGPVLDVGPYYVANLIQLIGPVKRVAALDQHAAPRTRTITAKGRASARTSRSNTPTTIHALLEFDNGAAVTLNASWDVWAHGQRRSSSTAPKARSSCPTRTSSAARSRCTQQRQAVKKLPRWDHPLRRAQPAARATAARQLPHRRPGRHGDGDPRRRGRTAARWTRRCTAIDVMTGDPEVRRDRQVRRHADHLRPAGGARHRRARGLLAETLAEAGKSRRAIGVLARDPPGDDHGLARPPTTATRR